MSARLLTALLALLLFSPGAAPAQSPATPPQAPKTWKVAPDVQVTELRPGVWIHTSWLTFPDGTRSPSNGLIVRDGDHLLLIDTAWGELLTDQLLDWIDSNLKLRVAQAVVTHSHHDRIGGAAALQRRNIKILTHPLTKQLASEQGLPQPEALADVKEVGSSARIGSVEVFYPGPGHARDNLMVWLPEQKILFGGCAVRAASAKGLGNVAHADTAAWPLSIRRALERYGAAEVVVPGHGDAGDLELLRHTLSLLQ